MTSPNADLSPMMASMRIASRCERARAALQLTTAASSCAQPSALKHKVQQLHEKHSYLAQCFDSRAERSSTSDARYSVRSPSPSPYHNTPETTTHLKSIMVMIQNPAMNIVLLLLISRDTSGTTMTKVTDIIPLHAPPTSTPGMVTMTTIVADTEAVLVQLH